MKVRGKWQGMLSIARFNWPFYLLALLLLVVGLCGLLVVNSIALKVLLLSGCGVAVYFVFVSLGVSHFIYDRSDLYRWAWLRRALPNAELNKIVICHSGLDECSVALRQLFQNLDWYVLDHFDPETMTEASILRARKIIPPTLDAIPCPYYSWPVPNEQVDLVFGILAIHEFRSLKERVKWFMEAKRCLRSGARVVLVEHLRDVVNFLAFGPGFLHFHSAADWWKSWEKAGLQLRDQYSITPFVRVFVLVKL